MSTLLNRFALLALIAALIILAATNNLFAFSPIVIAVQAGALALSVWARRSFPRGSFRVAAEPAAESIIRRGPYRLIRHPMYTAALTFVWAGILAHRTATGWTVGAVLTLIVAARAQSEERVLRERYPDYVDYARSTKMVVPYLF